MSHFIYRSSITGRVVTKEFAEANPDNTTRELVHTPVSTIKFERSIGVFAGQSIRIEPSTHEVVVLDASGVEIDSVKYTDVP